MNKLRRILAMLLAISLWASCFAFAEEVIPSDSVEIVLEEALSDADAAADENGPSEETVDFEEGEPQQDVLEEPEDAEAAAEEDYEKEASAEMTDALNAEAAEDTSSTDAAETAEEPADALSPEDAEESGGESADDHPAEEPEEAVEEELPAADDAESAQIETATEESASGEAEALPGTEETAAAEEAAADPMPVEKILVKQHPGKVQLGESFQLELELYPLDQMHAVRYESKVPGIAQVDENGLITTVQGGQVEIIIRDVASNYWTTAYVDVQSDEHYFDVFDRRLEAYRGIGGNIVIPEGIATIDRRLFELNSNITSVVMPDTVTGLGDEIFFGCTNLEYVRLSNKLKTIPDSTFTNCLKLGRIEFPQGLESIGEYAFAGCWKLTFDALPQGLSEIEDSTFYGCKSLERVVIPENVAKIGSNAFGSCEILREVILPEGLVSIGSTAFNSCKELRGIRIPASVTSIGSSAFSGTPIREITLPRQLTKIEIGTFSGCRELTEIVVPEGVESIGVDAFRNCTGLRVIELPSSLREIQYRAFEGCESALYRVPKDSYAHRYCEENGLRYEFNGEMLVFHIEDGVLLHYYGQGGDVVVPDGVTEIAMGVFAGKNVSSIALPAGLKKIGARAFTGCRELKTLELPQGVVEIGESAFEECASLHSVKLPEGLQEMGEAVFKGCSSLKEISIPGSVKKVPDEAFRHCVGLEAVALGDGVEEVGNYAFAVTGPMLSSGVLSSVRLSNTLKKIGTQAFASLLITEIEFPEGLEEIGNGAFSNNMGLTNVVLREGLLSIGQNAFYGCGLETVYLPESLNSIGKNCFLSIRDYRFEEYPTFYVRAVSYSRTYCEENGLIFFLYGDYSPEDAFHIEEGKLLRYLGKEEVVVIPESVSIIGRKAFYGNLDMVRVEFHDGIRYFEESAFENCTALKSVTLPGTMESEYFQGRYFVGCTALETIVVEEGIDRIYNFFQDCTSLRSVRLPSTLKTIGNHCFDGCINLEEINIPAALENIGEYAFQHCSSLKEIEIPDKVKELGRNAFMGCSALQRIKLPAKLKTIGDAAFSRCSSLVQLILPDGVQEISNYAFANCAGLLDIYIPDSVRKIRISDPIWGGGDLFVNTPNVVVRCKAGSTIANYCKKLGYAYTTNAFNPNLMDFSSGNAVIGVGQTFNTEVFVYGNMAGEIVYSTSNAKTAAVDKHSGEVTGMRAGNATITATAESGLKATCKISVKAAPKSISLSQSRLTLAVGEEYALSYSLTKDSCADVRFESSADSVAGVDADGLVRANAEGSAEIRAITHNGKEAVCALTVLPAPENLFFEKEREVIYEGSRRQLIPFVNEGSICNAYVFSSSDPSVVEVDENGMIQALGRGTVEITAEIPRLSLRAACTVRVIAPPRIELAAQEFVLGVGDSLALSPEYISEEEMDPGAFTYKAKNSRYAAVSEDGVVKAKAAGKTQISISAADGTQAQCTIVVKRAPSSIKLAPAHSEMGVGQTAQLSWKLNNNTAASVRFSSSDPAILEVDGNGMLTARAAGRATVTAQTHNGKKASAEVEIFSEPVSVRFEREELVSGVGQKGAINAILSEGSRSELNYESSNAAVFRIDGEKGTFEALGEGEAIVTVRTHNGLSAACTVKVLAAPVFMAFDQKTVSIGVGEEYKPILRMSGPGNRDFLMDLIFKSSNSRVVAVDEDGVLTAKRAGSATISVKSYNGLTTSCKVTVKKAPASIKLNAYELEMGRGESFKLKAAVVPSTAAAVLRFESSDPQRLKVDQEGNIYVDWTEGTETITVSSYNGLTASCTVTFGNYPTGARFPVDEITIPKGQKAQVLAYPIGGVSSVMRYTIDDPKIVNFNDDFELVARKVGRTRVRASTYNDKVCDLYVNVVAVPKKYEITLPEQLNVGYSYNLLEYFTNETGVTPELSIKSAKLNNEKALLSESEIGLMLTVLEAGSFKLTINTISGKKISKRFTAVETESPFVPQEDSPVNTGAEKADYSGLWHLESISVDGMACNPEVFGIHGNLMVNYPTRLQLNGKKIHLSYSMDGYSMILKTENGESFRANLHENGKLSVLFQDGVVCWFGK